MWQSRGLRWGEGTEFPDLTYDYFAPFFPTSTPTLWGGQEPYSCGILILRALGGVVAQELHTSSRATEPKKQTH